MPRLARKAGNDKRFHAHGLRHTRAARLRTPWGGGEDHLAAAGPESLLTMIRYLDHIQPMAVIEAIKAEPR